MSNDEKAESKEGPKTFPQLIWAVIKGNQEGTMSFLKFLLVVIFGVHPDLRNLMLEVAENQWTRFQFVLNWTINHINSTVRAVIHGALIGAVLIALALVGATQIPTIAGRGPVIVILELMLIGLGGAIFFVMIDPIARFRAALELAKTEGVKEITPESLAGLAARGASNATHGIAKAIGDLGRKLGMICVTFAGLVGFYLIMIPVHNIGPLVWSLVPSALCLVGLQIFRGEGKQPIWWHFVNITMVVYITIIIPLLSMVPQLLILLGMEHGSWTSIWINLLAYIILLVIGISIYRHAQKSSAGSAVAEPAKPATPTAAAPSKAKGGGNIVGRVLVTVSAIALCLFAVLALIVLSGRWPDFKEAVKDIKSFRVANHEGSPGENYIETKTPFSFKVKSSLVQTEVECQQGDMIIVRVIQEKYTALNATVTTDGIWGGIIATPDDYRVSLKPEVLSSFPELNRPRGLMFARVGQNGQLQDVGLGAAFTVTETGRLGFLLNIPQLAEWADEYKGTIVLEITKRHPSSQT